jgi:hypothetical protein
MSTATAGALGFFAAGRVGSHLGFWSSTDGIHWSESTDAERVISAAPGARINTLLAEGTAVYAAGSVTSGAFSPAALWSSGDGLNWHQVTSAPTSFSGSGARVITSLAPLGTGLVAVGAVAAGSTWFPASWISPNGVSWSQPSVRFPVPGYGAGSVVQAVTSETTLAGSSNLYAVGGSSQRQYLWHSTDGLEWLPVPLPPAATTATAWQATLASTYQGTTIVADGDPGQPHVLVGANGRWSEPSAVPATFGTVQPFAYPAAVATSGGRIRVEVKILTPAQAVGAYTTSTAVITSANAESWQAGTVADMTGTPPSLPGRGAIATRYLGAWVAVTPATGLATTNQYAGGAARSWTSAGGISWTTGGPLLNVTAGTAVPNTSLSAPSTSAGAPSGSGATKQATPSGLCVDESAIPSVIAVGTTSLSTPGTGASAWLSHDGVSWLPAQVQPAPSPSGVEQMVGCVATGANLVAYGSSTVSGTGPEPALWRSAGGMLWSRQPVIGFLAGTPYPLDSLVVQGSTWLATAGLPTGPGPAVLNSPDMVTPGWGGPGAYRQSGVDLGSLLISSDGGVTWATVPTSGGPWAGVGVTALSSVGFAGATPVVFGSVDGRLAVWIGVLASDAAS